MDWLRNQMDARDLSQRELANKIGITEQMFTNVMAGRRLFKASEADAIRRFFGYSLPEDTPRGIAVAGRVAAGDNLVLVDDFAKGDGLYQIERPQWVAGTGVVAAEIQGQSASPWALPGNIIFWRRHDVTVFQEDLGRPVIAELENGHVMLKKLGASEKKGHWSLYSINPSHPNLLDVKLIWAARVMAPLPRDQVRFI